jgi:hypothetical protein
VGSRAWSSVVACTAHHSMFGSSSKCELSVRTQDRTSKNQRAGEEESEEKEEEPGKDVLYSIE